MVDWTSDRTLRYSQHITPAFDYSTGKVKVVKEESLCDECAKEWQQEMDEAGIVFEKTDNALQCCVPIPDDYEPPPEKVSRWRRLKQTFFPSSDS
jgi:hypothetical protein